MRRWPTPGALADAAPGEAVREWGRLGYPRRALRLHAAAVAIDSRYDGQVPSSVEDLLSLPGVGAYTARAVAAFAYRQRHAVLDTNVRRVLARCLGGRADAGALGHLGRVGAGRVGAPRRSARTQRRYSVAVMELGALVCTVPFTVVLVLPARAPLRVAGARDRPALEGRAKRPQGYAGTDRQVRGRLLAVLRDAEGPVPPGALTGRVVRRRPARPLTRPAWSTTAWSRPAARRSPARRVACGNYSRAG